jgi:hypothetical protein
MADERRNINPHAEARLAMALWSEEYSAQRGGSMDFWDGLSESRKALCIRLLNDILIIMNSAGRARP